MQSFWYRIPSLFLYSGIILGASSGLAAPGDLRHRVYEMPVEVELVHSLGAWSWDNKQGYFRLIVTGQQSVYKRQTFWVQWICQCNEGRISMVGLNELSELQPYVITSQPAFMIQDDIPKISFRVKNTRTRVKRSVQVELKMPGQYQLHSTKLRENRKLK